MEQLKKIHSAVVDFARWKCTEASELSFDEGEDAHLKYVGYLDAGPWDVVVFTDVETRERGDGSGRKLCRINLLTNVALPVPDLVNRI